MSRRRSLIEDERAAIYVEFLVVFWPVFLLFLATLQIGLAQAADLALQHSADAAARSAIVVLPDDPEYNNDTDKNKLAYNGTPNPGFVNKVLDLITKVTEEDILSDIAGDDVSTSFLSNAFNKGDTRLNFIRFAAFRPMLPFSPHPSEIINIRENILGSINGAGTRMATGLLYNTGALAVTFPDSPGATISPDVDEVTFAGGSQPLTVRTTYMFHCGVPFVGQIMCNSAAQLHTQSAEGQAELNYAIAPIITNGFAMFGVGAAIAGANQACFLVLRREATLTYQGAAYQYRSEGL